MAPSLDTQAALFYGQFVLAAYAMFDNPNNADPLRPEPLGIPPSYELGAWIQMSDFILNKEEPKFYGIVAHSIADPNSRIIAIRGTEHLIEWLDDAFVIPVPFRQVPAAGRVAGGFDKIYSTLKVVKRRLPGATAHAVGGPTETARETFSGSFADQLEQLASSREAERAPVGAAPAAFRDATARPLRPTVVTGHSLGAALSTLFAMENHAKRRFEVNTLCTFASPRVGNMEFVHTFNQIPIHSWRIFNQRDIVPKIPFHIPLVADYGHVDVAYPVDSSTFAKNNLVCWHSMNTYLHALDMNFALLPQCVP